jgi:predicted GH43/DUF377 family glycosyl hydrolase
MFINKTECLKMFKWKKLGRVFNPLEVKNKSWLKEFAQAPATLVFDNFVRVYFSCRPERDADGQYVSYTGYVDLNRHNLFEIVGSSENPIMELGELGTFDEFGTYPTSVIRNGEEIIAYYGGWTRCESVPYNVAIGMAISRDDGVTFTKQGSGPVLSFSVNEPMTVSGPKIRRFNGQWYLWYVAGRKWKVADGRPESIFKIRMATSVDGINWKKRNVDLIENILEEDECQASPDVLFFQNKYHMFFSYKYSSNFRNTERGYRIGYASSDDLIHWTREDSKAGIDISSGDAWDNQSVAYPHVFELDNKIYMMYLGNEVGRYGFGLAMLEDFSI